MNSTVTPSNTVLQVELNDHMVNAIIPTIAYVAVLMILGVVGNVCSLYFYGFKCKQKPNIVFIVVLAAADLCMCLLSMPMEIADMAMFYVFTNVPACKSLRFLTHSISMFSVLILLVIALERRRGICSPYKRKLSLVQAKLACAINASIALFLSWPMVIFYDVIHVNITHFEFVQVEVSDCTVRKDSSLQIYLYVINCLYIFGFVVIATIITVCYCCIGYTVLQHRTLQRHVQSFQMVSNYIARPSSSTTTGSDRRVSIGNHPRSYKYSSNRSNKRSTECRIPTVDSVTELITAEVGENGIIDHGPLSEDTNVSSQSGVIYLSELSHSQERDMGTNGVTMYFDSIMSNSGTSSTETDMQVTVPARERAAPADLVSGISSTKYTLIMFVVTLLFVVSFLPFLALSLWRTLINRSEVADMTDKELNIYSIGIRSYLISCSVNPLVYGLFNTKFRQFFVNIIRTCIRTYHN
ncbi:hypothetical protein ACJMK2_000523 [Sinanodonta woodiana]|uniref:G-protein coupled receptors family 1 profile domain-containing protein n=1 Tax=Sinanodonta woodiana TaxID=1069815 RepID=A0ABD3XT07_SINWO